MKLNIFDQYTLCLMKKIKPEKKLFSPNKNACIILYNRKDIYKGFVYYYDFSVLYFNIESELVEISSAGMSINCWYEENSISWSKDSAFCSISIVVKDIKRKVSFEAKIIIDTKKQAYTAMPLAGSRNSKIKFEIGNNINISTKATERNEEYIEILSKTTNLKNFKWVPLSDFDKINALFYQGYFGNIVGYKDKKMNIYFKNVKNKWPYNDIK